MASYFKLILLHIMFLGESVEKKLVEQEGTLKGIYHVNLVITNA